MEERAENFRGVLIHKGIPKHCQRDSCVEYVNGGAIRVFTAQELCTAFRHAIGRYLWSLTGEFSPGVCIDTEVTMWRAMFTVE
jgi:hypothetical protein